MRGELMGEGKSEPRLVEQECDRALETFAGGSDDLRRYEAELRKKRGSSDVNHGAEPEQVPAHGWVP